MPTYEYICKTCGYTLEELQSMKEEPLLRCPRCNKDTLARVIGSGGALIFKGSGFYGTDYKKSNSPPTPPDGKEKEPDTKKETAPPPATPPPEKKE